MAFVYDAHGNVGQLVDEGGVVAKYEYDAFGQTLVASGVAANENARRFSTKYADEETGLVYYGYRYYWPEMGRWTNRDPSGEQHGANLLLMVSNDPINYGDPFGLYQYPTHFTISTNAVRAMPERCLCGWKTTLYAMPAYSIMNDQPEGFFAMKGILRDMDGPNRKLTQALAKDSITYRSHFGDLQIWHSMWDGFSDPTSLRARIVGHVLDRIEFARWKHDDGDDLGAAQELGFAVHAVEDSYSASHVARDSDGSVLTYQNYVTQSHSKHSFADFGVIDEQDRADTRRFYNSGQHVFSGTVSAATMAVNDLLQLMVCKKASEGQLRNYLEAEVYRHTSNTGVGTTETS
jgi:RHS repeat-associated protein